MIGRVGIADQELVQAWARAVGIVIMNPTKGQSAGPLALGEVRVALGMGDEHRGAADLQSVIDFRRLIAIVERCGHQPGADAGEVMNDQLATIWQERCDAVAGLEPQR
jgi:hypothetical protein